MWNFFIPLLLSVKTVHMRSQLLATNNNPIYINVKTVHIRSEVISNQQQSNQFTKEIIKSTLHFFLIKNPFHLDIQIKDDFNFHFMILKCKLHKLKKVLFQ